ncbi:MAG: DUF2764 domain-containing protein [Rikenellaceae bacterium]|jgi:hypothetical protein|nr:DUF2764 domain-containing protein [Rikenellaceae bacterium]
MAQYHCLIAGLRELQADAEAKGFDTVALRDEIVGDLTPADAEVLREFYFFYDVANLIALLAGKNNFSALGNLSVAELREAVGQTADEPGCLPPYVAEVLSAYRSKKDDKGDDDSEIDTEQPIEKVLWSRYYERMGVSPNGFVRAWYAFDRTLRNVCAAITARAQEREIGPELVGQGEIETLLARSSASDFGLKNELDYLDRLFHILDETNMVDKERRLDALRWDTADELTVFEYFTLDKVLAYCVKINIIHRWMALDKAVGRAMFERLVADLSGIPAQSGNTEPGDDRPEK